MRVVLQRLIGSSIDLIGFDSIGIYTKRGLSI